MAYLIQTQNEDGARTTVGVAQTPVEAGVLAKEPGRIVTRLGWGGGEVVRHSREPHWGGSVRVTGFRSPCGHRAAALDEIPADAFVVAEAIRAAGGALAGGAR
ncbi:MAG: hypothetical protein RLZZ373_3231 [Pseudomonadota bacterium]